MRTGKLDFKTANGFPDFVMVVSVALIFFGGFALLVNVIVGAITVLIGITGVSTQERLMIDFDKKRYKLYTQLLFFKLGELERFEQIEYVFIKTNKVSKKINSYAGAIQTSTIHKTHFDAYLRFSDTDKVHIAGEESKEKTIKAVKPIAKQLGLEIVDYTLQET